MDILEKNKDIINLLFFINLFILICSFFYFTRTVLIILCFINIILLFSHIVINKYSYIFNGLIVTNKIAKGLNSTLSKLN